MFQVKENNSFFVRNNQLINRNQIFMQNLNLFYQAYDLNKSTVGNVTNDKEKKKVYHKKLKLKSQAYDRNKLQADCTTYQELEKDSLASTSLSRSSLQTEHLQVGPLSEEKNQERDQIITENIDQVINLVMDIKLPGEQNICLEESLVAKKLLVQKVEEVLWESDLDEESRRVIQISMINQLFKQKVLSEKEKIRWLDMTLGYL